MNYRSLSSTFVGALCITVLAACGGGGGGDTSAPVTPPPVNNPPPTTASFPLAAGFKARIDTGVSDTFDITDGCVGTATITLAPATPATFEGVTGVASPQTSTATLNNCTPASSSSAGFTYYNASYANVGLAVTGGEYAVFQAAPTAPTALPATARIGDSGTIVTLNTYNNSSKATLTGTRVIKWRVEADGTSTTSAIFNLVIENYNTLNLLLSTQQSRYRMAQSGALAITTIDVQFSGTSVLHLLYTKR